MTSAAPIPRPGIGIAIDRYKLKALREAALLERIDLSELSQLTDLRDIAAGHKVKGYALMNYDQLLDVLRERDIPLPRHIGVSRDCIAKIENGDRLRPKISTLRLLIDTLNAELARRGLDTIGVEDLYPDPPLKPADGPPGDLNGEAAGS
jgi:DNA-binding XRE family transcriptional regulator